MNLNPQIVAALAKCLEKEAKAGREGLAPGDYKIDAEVTLGVRGSVAVSADEEYTATTHIPLKPTLALFMRYSGITGQAALDALVRAMNDALALDALPAKERKTAEASIRELADLDAAEERVLAGLAAMPTATRKGKVVVKAKVEVLATSAEALPLGETAKAAEG